jgi:hypothetical protein
MIHWGLVSHCLLKLDVLISQIFKMRGVDRNGPNQWAMCYICFFGQLLVIWPNYSQYKHNLFAIHHCFSYSMRGLNYILSIYMELSLNANAINGDNLFNMKKNYSGDNTQHISWCHSKNLLLHQIILGNGLIQCHKI